MEQQSLAMIFIGLDGKKVTITIDDPDEYLTPEKVKAVMQKIVEKDILETRVIEIHSAQLVTRTVNPLMMD